MKVLHIYAGNLFGGIETFLISLAKGQHLCSEMTPHFALCFEGKLARELRHHQAPVHLLGNVKISRIWTVWRSQQQLKALIERENFDVVICHACWSQAIFGRVVTKPLVFWCHDAIIGDHWLDRLARTVKPKLAIVNSEYTKTFLEKFYDVPTKIILYPVDSSATANSDLKRQQTRQSLNTNPEKIVIIQVSRLERWKGQSLLLSALGQLKDLSAWECWIVGGVQRPQEEAYLQELKNQVQDLEISTQVKFLGQRSDVPDLLAAADMHCQPNLGGEPFGITFIEALYAGLPVVTTNMGGGAEIVNSSCGILVEPNPLELANALRSLINSKSQRQELGSHGHDRAVELCDPAQQINQLYTCLNFEKPQTLV